MEENNQYQFQVNMKGMIELLSEHIYSSPTVFIRELLQNGMDAVTMRKGIDPDVQGQITVTFLRDKIVFQDNGIGLSQADMHQFLSVIGQSSKKGALVDKELIGKFGIGLLSCLVVSEEIEVESRSLLKGESFRWKGRADGTYTVAAMEALPEVGTRVILLAKPEWKSLFSRDEIRKNVLFYGSALPIKVVFCEGDEREEVLDGHPIWLDKDASKDALMEYGKTVFKTRFLDVFRLESDAGELQGVAYVIPNKVSFSSTKEHKIFLKRMYLCDQATNLLPEWSSFVRCIINTNALQPTASRESLMNNAVLKQTKKELSDCFKDYLKVLSMTDAKKIQQLITVHHLYIKALAAADTEIMTLFLDYLPFETNKGLLSFQDIKQYGQQLYYTPSLDDFRQLRRIAGSQNKMVINAAYSYESDLIERIKRADAQLKIDRIVPQDLLDELEEALDLSAEFKRFVERADLVLQKQFCRVAIKNFKPQDTPTLYIANEEALSNKNIKGLTATANPFASTLQHFIKDEKVLPTLCFNQGNDLIKQLVYIDDELLFEAVIQIMYIQALMLGGYTINKKEMDVFNDALYQLLIMGMSQFLPKI
ncbi:HSP90 family protein [Flavobacterium sp. JP2137]|uniref:HSP90 family protein n=1 Tax=Flavobacterium sp. JP2137 TaxID=3414510 RepID=UPI003D2FD4C8